MQKAKTLAVASPEKALIFQDFFRARLTTKAMQRAIEEAVAVRTGTVLDKMYEIGKASPLPPIGEGFTV
jgi:hypothetical protein